jgi:hypothetical protein
MDLRQIGLECEDRNRVGFEVFTAVSMMMAVFWVVAPCSLVELYQRFRGPCCLHHQGNRPTTQKTAIFVIELFRKGSNNGLF